MPDRSDEAEMLRTVADYQYGAGAGHALFPAGEPRTVERSRSGRPRQVHTDGGRLVTFTTAGRFTLGLEGGRRLHDALPHPAYRVAVGDESEPFVADGRNAFAKFVREADPAIRAADEVMVVCGDRLIGVGRAELSAAAMQDFGIGVAVTIRSGVGTG